ncbi:MAG: hypothetical protein ACK4UN_13880 [Limisphaerales bacterium]
MHLKFKASPETFERILSLGFSEDTTPGFSWHLQWSAGLVASGRSAGRKVLQAEPVERALRFQWPSLYYDETEGVVYFYSYGVD